MDFMGGPKNETLKNLGSRLSYFILLTQRLVSYAANRNHLRGRLHRAAQDFPRHAEDSRQPRRPDALYPKWIPGEHAPDGPVIDLAGLKFSAGGKPLKWRRDLLDGFTIHVDVPAGASEVDAELDFLSPATFEGGFSAGSSATDKLAVISWNQVLLYPKGFKSDDINYTASLKLPEGWKFGTPLPIAKQTMETKSTSPPCP
jgi:hypothetical protein